VAPVPAPRRGIPTRRAIERAATELFAELGYHATSMQRISAAAGVQAAAIYHWFPSKEALLAHLQDEFMRQLNLAVAAAMEPHADPVVRLAATVRAHVVYHGLHSQEAFVTDSEIRALAEEPRAALIAQRDRYQDLFCGLIDEGVAAGSLTSSSARVATYAILLQCTGVAMWFKPDGPLTLDEVADLHVDLVLSSLHASREVVRAATEAVRTPLPQAAQPDQEER